MSENFSEERKIKIGLLNRNKIFSEKEREVMRKAAFFKYKNQPGLKIRISNAQSKPLILIGPENQIHSEYLGVRKMANVFGCCHKTINKCIKNGTIFKNIGIIKYKNKY